MDRHNKIYNATGKEHNIFHQKDRKSVDILAKRGRNGYGLDPYAEFPSKEHIFGQVEPKMTFNQTTYQQGFNSGAEKADFQKVELAKIVDMV